MHDAKSKKLTAAIEAGVTAEATVASSLGFPNNRVEESASPTGWQASKLNSDGTADQSEAKVNQI